MKQLDTQKLCAENRCRCSKLTRKERDYYFAEGMKRINSSPVYQLARQLHSKHCSKYGLTPDWESVGEFYQEGWIAKARRKLIAQPVQP